MSHERLKPSFVFDEERLNQLKQIAPEAFADGKINWDALKEALGEYTEEEGQEAEHFGLFWPGKREARKLASIPSKGTLVPAKGEGIDEDKTRNIFIEGENLEVLKLLQKSYAGKIKMIYIDPPYNTGNDFVYDDNFTEPLQEYLKYTGQMDEEGRVLTTNTKADGRFHSKWLSMMYPRLRLARNFLTDDGLIFISIDDNEMAGLRKVCDEVFGEENWLATLIWNRGHSQQQGIFKEYHEYVLVYAKGPIEPFGGGSGEIIAGAMKKISRANPASDFIFPAGTRFDAPDGTELKDSWGDVEKVYLVNGRMVAEDGKLKYEVKLKAGWTQANQMKDYFYGNKEDVVDTRGQKVLEFFFNSTGKLKCRKGRERITPITVMSEYGTGGSVSGKLAEIFGLEQSPINNPKPVEMLKDFVKYITQRDKSEVVMDFFAGSATLANAVYELNLELGVNQRFICVQLPELIDKDEFAYKKGYTTISDIAKARIKLAIKLLKNKDQNRDCGVKVYKLDKSNFRQWQDYKGKDLKELQQVFEHWQSPLVDGWKEDNLMVEILLQEGFPLDSKMELLTQYSKNKIIQVTSEFCEHKLLICLDKKVTQEIIDGLVFEPEDRFICLDSALIDEQKVRLSDKGFLKTI